MVVRKFGVINDLHIPFHDEKAVSLVLDIFADIGIDDLYINGDLLDFYSINAHGAKHPDIHVNLETELESGLDFIKLLRKKLPKARVIFKFGNHEWRLDRFIMNNAPAFWNIVKLENQLQLNHYKIESTEYNHPTRVGKTNLYIQHSPPSYSENAAMTSLKKKMDASFIFGCTHRRDYACKTGVNGALYEVFCNGWLGDIASLSNSHKNVFNYTKGHENWQQCFGIGHEMGEHYDYKQYNIYKKGSERFAIVEGFYYET